MKLSSLALLLGVALGLSAHAATSKPEVIHYQVKVVDSKGQPVPKAKVELYHVSTSLLNAEGQLRADERRTTDRNGATTFTVTRGEGTQTSVMVVVQKSGLSLGWATCNRGGIWGDDSGDNEVEITLTPPASVAGVVRDAAGKPVTGAQVWVQYAYRQRPSDGGLSFGDILAAPKARDYLSTRTGHDGKFRLDRLPADATLKLGVLKPGLALDQPSDPNFVPANLNLQAGQSNVVLTLKPAGLIEGTVVQEGTGAPIAKARVSEGYGGYGSDAPAPVITRADGGFRLENLSAGTHRVRVAFSTNQLADWACEPVSVKVEAGTTNRATKFTATRGGVLELTVREAGSGLPVQHASFSLSRDTFGESGNTSAQGVARLRLVPGQYYLFVNKSGLASHQEQVTVESGQTNQLAVELKTLSKLTGTVLDPDGKPAPKVAIISMPFTGPGKRTDAQGRFTLAFDANRFAGMPQAGRVLIARDLTRHLAVAVGIDAEATNATLRLAPGLTLAGRVVDEQGRALTNAEAMTMIQSERGMGTSLGAPARVDATGHFEIKDLPRDYRYDVTVSAKGYGREQHRITAQQTSGARAELEPFTLPTANLRLAGTVVDSEDKPVSGASVSISGDKQPQSQTRTDAKGHFVLEQVCSGPVSVSANAPNGSGYGNANAEGGDTNVVIQLGAAGRYVSSGSGRFSGKVTGSDSQPAARAEVTLFPFNGATRTADAQGNFKIAFNPQEWNADYQRVIIARDLARNLAAALDVDADVTNANLQLEPALTIVGRVTGPGGKPISKAEVHVIFYTDRSGSSLGSGVHADADGRFEIKALPRGRRYGINTLATGFGTDNRSVEPAETDTRVDVGEVQLPVADQRLAGIVLDDDDKPVVGANVNCYGEKQPYVSAKTDSKGRFQLEKVCAGSIQLSANAPRGGSYGNGKFEAGDTNVVIHISASPSYGSSGTSRFSGKVTGPDGQPAAKVQITLFPYHGSTKRTDAEGTFKLSFSPEEWGGNQQPQRVLIGRDQARNLAAALDVEPETTNADLRLEPALTLAGRVTGPGGKPITNASLYVMFHTERIGSSLDSNQRTDATGHFEFKALPKGRRYSVNASAPGFGQDNRSVESAEAENRVEVADLQLPIADQRIAGVVLDENEKPVSGANIYCYENKQPNISTRTDSKGRFHVDQVCAGPIRLSVNGPRGGYANVTAEGGDTNITVQISSSPGERMSAPQPAKLKGKPLPDLAPLGLAAADCPNGQPVLLLLMDAEQRPSRRVLRLLTEQAAALKEKGVAVLVLQVGSLSGDALAAWKKEENLPFPVGTPKEAPEKAHLAWGAGALPWLILADKDHKVAAEGFSPEELDAKLQAITK